MAKAYYGSRISANMTKTPEGFLICHSVPIGRVTSMKYHSSELGLEGNEVVEVFREESEVFDQRALASFEGKAFTDTHPAEDVNTNNWSIYAKGELTNVRRGTGEYSDCMVADIIVRDPTTISQIESGVKREVSSGYECDYEKVNGKMYQKNIIGNHVSLVQAGRAGDKVAIHDAKNISVMSAQQLKTEIEMVKSELKGEIPDAMRTQLKGDLRVMESKLADITGVTYTKDFKNKQLDKASRMIDEEIKANRPIISKANKITAKYSKWIEPKQLQEMYNELKAIGITTGMIHGSNSSCEWYLNGQEVSNSKYVYKVYKDDNRSTSKNEYTIYFS